MIVLSNEAAFDSYSRKDKTNLVRSSLFLMSMSHLNVSVLYIFVQFFLKSFYSILVFLDLKDV